MNDLGVYLGLFASAFGAASLLPAQSEVLLVALLLDRNQAVWALLTVASFGNVLGSMLNWLLGRSLERYRERRWFPATPARLEQARRGDLAEGSGEDAIRRAFASARQSS